MKLALGAYHDRVAERVSRLTAGSASQRIWGRDTSFWGGDADRASSVENRLGWLAVGNDMRGRIEEIQRFAAQVRADGFTDAVLLGMGGSSLAPEVLRLSIAEGEQHGERWPALHVLDTTDPATIGAVTSRIDPARALFFVSSKSGTTIEALSLFEYFHSLVEARKPGGAGENFVAITDDGTPLKDLAKQHNFRAVFANPSDIGGRYSALSYFGLVPAAVAGVDIAKLIDRGVAAEEASRAPDSEALTLGAALGELALAGRDKCTFIVAPKIASFGLWVEQLIAESTGKLGKGILPVAGEPLGTSGQYGDDRIFVQLRLGGDANAVGDVAGEALASTGFPVITIDLEDVYDLGCEFFRWEYAIAVAGQVLGINPFDEPNVQESKDNTARVLKEFEATGQLKLDTVAPSSPESTTALSELVGDLGPGDYFAITAYLRPTAYSDAECAHMRAAVRDACHVATTLGYGPRFLHSTGQFHKGGPSRGVFLQLIGDFANDIAIPGKAFTFGQLKRAQAIGDRQSLLKHGLSVVSVDVGHDALNVERVFLDLKDQLAKLIVAGGR